MKIFKYTFLIIAFLTGLSLHGKIYNLDLGQFEKLKIDANVSVVYQNLPDSTGMARYEAPAGADKLFILTVKGNGTLRVQLGQQADSFSQIPVLYVYSDFLNSVESSSDLTVLVQNPAPSFNFNAGQTGNGSIIVENIKCTNLSASLTTGNGSVNVSGSCVNANLRMVGTGTIYADRLRAENVNCKIMGTGSIGCWPIDNLNVKGLGTTKIYYKGHPNIKKSGGGKLFDLQDDSDQDYEKSGVPVKTFENPPVNENEALEDAKTVIIEETSEEEETIEVITPSKKDVSDDDDEDEDEDEDEEDDDDDDDDEEDEEDNDDPDDTYQTVVTKDD